MKKTIIIYYSNNKSNEYLATYLSKELGYDIAEIIPRISSQILLMIGLGGGIKRINANLNSYDRVILVGPVWMGKFIYPLKKFIKKYKDDISDLVFITCCGSSYDMKDEKYGHGQAFNDIKSLFPEKDIQCHAFPITLVLNKEELADAKKVMETRLNNTTFKGKIKEKVDKLISELKN